MVFHTNGFSALLLAIAGSTAIASPGLAEVSWAWANLRTSTYQVSLVSASGNTRSAAVADCFCPGEILNTGAAARAEVLFNDGSLTRVGEQASLRFWPDTRKLLLNQGTVALFVPPSQGRTTVQTPNATVGLNSTAVVVRYVPSRQLTLVMALADLLTAPVLVTAAETGQELALYGGQMAFIGDGSWQVVEFDLLEFYQTSVLMAGLHLDDPAYRPDRNDPLAAVRPDLLRTLEQQTPFNTENAILDPALINDFASEVSTQGVEDLLLTTPAAPVEELRRLNDTPPGVVNPLPALPATASPPTASPLTVEAPPAEGSAATPVEPSGATPASAGGTPASSPTP
ncbi:FecR domain-containing protein [Nodosilinea sp. FACHB-131]|uniref:FecR domain-containing protein n=1 Tax=Cyanophyceae TaxID=3028117 RepID=UPI001685CE91|nr:FecR domain-containing protein [Nodosilinea sp. FACHB-131]MBD1872273.1 FecR domain-containing protein [Nodosilinea sp. FACHB-131]